MWRDEYQGANVLRLRDEVSGTRKILIWAHHSHVAHFTAAAKPDEASAYSAGAWLYRRVPDALYTIDLFGERGRYLQIREAGPGRGESVTEVGFDDHDRMPRPRLAPLVRAIAPVGPVLVGLQRVAAAPAATNPWLRPVAFSGELEEVPFVPGRDCHAVVLVPEISPPRLPFLRWWMRIYLRLGGRIG